MRNFPTSSGWGKAFKVGPLAIGLVLLTGIAAGGAPHVTGDPAHQIVVAFRSHVVPAIQLSKRPQRNHAMLVATNRGLLRGWNEREVNLMPVPSQPDVPAPAALEAPTPVAEAVATAPAAGVPSHVTAGAVSAAPAPPAVVGSGQLLFINQDRAAAGLGPLAPSGCLDAIARQQAAAMAAAGQMFHGNGVTQALGCGLGSHTGENVAYRSGGISDAGANSQFMSSAPHRANILGLFHYAAAAWACSGDLCYIAVEFA